MTEPRPDAGTRPTDGFDPPGEPIGRWAQLSLVSLAVLLSLSAWLSATALGPDLQERWSLTLEQVGWLTTMVQVGFVAGTAAAAVLNLADVLSSRAYFSTSALLAAGANAALLIVPGYGTALAARFLTGMFLAGVYPPGMQMVSTWFRKARGLAIGTVVGALTVGKAMPWLMKAFGGPGLVPVVLGASLAGAVGAGLVAVAYRDGPFAPARRPFDWRRVGGILRHRPTMLATGGYLGHMWELYAMWTAMGTFFLAFFGLRSPGIAPLLAALATFGVIASGGVGAVLAGLAADRWGREEVASGAMAVSALCALSVGWLMEAPTWLVLALTLVWGITVVADSAQFSALVTEVAPPHAIGTALTLQTALGFALTALSIWLVFQVSGALGWGPAFSMLAVGPVLGILSMARLRAERRP